MDSSRFEQITSRYPSLRIGIVGDFCLDRYLEIDPSRAEISIETGLPVHNVTRIRSQPGAAGTILNNLVALGIGTIVPIGFCGDDGEGYELRRALQKLPGVTLDHFLMTPDCHTFVYCKPLVIEPQRPPRELSRFDTKNWSPTPEALSIELSDRIEAVACEVDALILMDQVDIAETGTVTGIVREAIRQVQILHPQLLILADSRRGLTGYPPVCWKTNRAELGKLRQSHLAERDEYSQDTTKRLAIELAKANGRDVFITLAEEGIIAASAEGECVQSPAFPVIGEIDIVGAGDAVTANLTAARAAGAGLAEAITLANAAASIVIHQLGTTGTASVSQLREKLDTNENAVD